MSREGASPTGLIVCMRSSTVFLTLHEVRCSIICIPQQRPKDLTSIHSCLRLQISSPILPSSLHHSPQSFFPTIPLSPVFTTTNHRSNSLPQRFQPPGRSSQLTPIPQRPRHWFIRPPSVSHKASHRDSIRYNCPLSRSTAAAVHHLYRTLQQLQPFLCAARRGWVHCVGSGADESTIVVW